MGRAEAEQMAKKAEAFQEYKDGAMVDMLLEKIPLVSNTTLHSGKDVVDEASDSLYIPKITTSLTFFLSDFTVSTRFKRNLD